MIATILGNILTFVVALLMTLAACGVVFTILYLGNKTSKGYTLYGAWDIGPM